MPTRHIIVLLGIACLAGSLAARVMDPFVAVLAAEFGAPPDRAALLGTAFALPFALVQPVLGPLGDAIGKRRIVGWALWLLAAFTLLAAMAPGLETLLVLRALAGAAAGGIMPLSLAAVGDAVPIEDRQVAISRLLVFAIGGQIAGGTLAGLLADLLGWRGVLGLCGLAALAAAAVLAWSARRAPPEPSGGRVSATAAVQRYRRIWRLPTARLLFGAVAAEGVLIFGVMPFLAPLLEARGGGGAGAAGLAVGAFGLGSLGYALLARRILAAIGQRGMVRLGGVLAPLALLGFAVADRPAGFALCGALLGLGFMMVHNSIQTRVTEVAPEARGSAVALHASCFWLGQALGPVAIGIGFGLAGAGPTLAVAALGFAALAVLLTRGG